MSRSLLAFAVTLLGCAAAGGIDCSNRHANGSPGCSHDVAAADLLGRWCDARPGYDLCLDVLEHSTPEGQPLTRLYRWTASDCAEYGLLTDNVTFKPASNPEGGCYAPLDLSPYGANVWFTPTGIEVAIHGPVGAVPLTYVGAPQSAERY